MNCSKCLYSNLIVAKDTVYKCLNPFGEDITRVNELDIYECRRFPPIQGAWPNVLEEGWCGEFAENSS